MRVRKQFISKQGICIILACATLLLLASACRQEKGTSLNTVPPVSLEAKLEPEAATLGDRITYTVTLSRAPEITADLPEFKPSIEALSQLDSGHSGPEQAGKRITEKRWYTLRADRTGTWVIPAFKMSYKQDGADKEIETRAITLTIKSVLPPEMKDIHGLKPLEKASLDRLTLIIIAALLLLLVMIALAAWRYWKRKKPEAVIPPLTPHEEAEQGLRRLEAMGLIDKEEFKEHYFLLSEIFRRYLERRFAFPAVERTTEEILGSLDSLRVEAPLRDEFRASLYNTDPVKFAGAACTKDEARAETDRVRRFIAETAEQAAAAHEEKEHVAV